MDLHSLVLRSMIVKVAERIDAGSDELCALDSAIGDGDHGTNMKRGSMAVLAKADAIVSLPTGEAMREIGNTIVMTVGGASGPLYGSFFLAAGGAIVGGRRLPEDLVDIVAAGVNAVGARGRSAVGEKTMLDVLDPILHVLEREWNRPDLCRHVRAVADELAQQTAPLLATKGRAAYLGARSIGHLDPGAKSSCLIVQAICDTLE